MGSEEKIATANLDGTKNAAADTDLFTYTVNNGWVQVGADAKDAEKKTITRVYAYASAGACTKLKAKENTPTLFDTVRFCNALEDQSLEESGKEIVVNGYAIQATDIGDESGSKTAPADVWSVLSKQKPSLTK